MQNPAEWVEAAYDKVAPRYDDLWSVHLRAPQRRLTEGLELVRGMRCADLGCGTGIDTVDMAERTAPSQVLAVDCSERMLEEARLRAGRRGCVIETVCADAARFVHGAAPSSFDVVTLRFCLAYLSWQTIVPALVRALRPRGKVGILTNLGTSAPQAYAVYRSMVDDLGVKNVDLPVPRSLEDLSSELSRHGLRPAQTWTQGFRLWFESGTSVSTWLSQSGFITHPALSAAPEAVRRALWSSFAARIEACRERAGIPLDFEVAGLVAVRA